MKLLLLLTFIYQFYFSSTGVTEKMITNVTVDTECITVYNGELKKTYQILEKLPDSKARSVKLERYMVYHNNKSYYVEINSTYFFLKSKNLEEVFSNFEIKLVSAPN